MEVHAVHAPKPSNVVIPNRRGGKYPSPIGVLVALVLPYSPATVIWAEVVPDVLG